MGLTVLLGILAVGAQSGCASVAPPSGAIGSFEETINESSGLIGSLNGDFLWTHNDSGDSARIFAVGYHGELLGEVRVDGATSTDWEAITSDGNGHLLIGDIGNNENQRRDLTIYVIPEPDPAADHVSVTKKLHFRYPEQLAFPDQTHFNFDAEALFWWKDRLFLLTKHRSDQNTVLYVFPEDLGTGTLELIRVAEATIGSMVTDAAISPDGSHLAVLTYAGITIYAAPDEGMNFLAHPIKQIGFHTNVTMQCEGLAWVDDSLYMTNEQKALHRLHNPLSKRFAMYP